MVSAVRFLEHGGEMGQRIRAFDWASHPLGPPECWPPALRFTIGLALGSSFPTAIYWGADFHLLYNDAWAPIPAERHPGALGRPAREVWSEIWDVIGPQLRGVVETGEGFVAYDQQLMMLRDGALRETYWNYSFTPVRDDDGQVVGVLNVGNETTRHVLGERDRAAQVERLRELFHQAPGAVALLHGENHRFVMGNRPLAELIGDRAFLGLPIAEAMPELIDQGFVDLLGEVFRTGEPFRGSGVPVLLARTPATPHELRIVDFVFQPIKDGAGITTDIFLQASDVTERAQVEARLRASDERLQLALNASTGIGTWDWNRDTRRVSGDARFAHLFGIAPERVLAGGSFNEVLELIHPNDSMRLAEAVRTAIEQHGPLSIEIRVQPRDAPLRWMLVRGQATYDMDGELAHFSGVAFDITERRATEEAARAAIDELHAAHEAQAFVYGLAEQLRALDEPNAIMELVAHALGPRVGADRVGFYRVAGAILHFGPVWTNGQLPPLAGTMHIEGLGGALDRYREGMTLVSVDTGSEFAGTEFARRTPCAVGVPLLRGGNWVATLYVNRAQPCEWAPEQVAFIEDVAEIAWDAVERAAAVTALRESEAQFRAIANSIDQMVWSTRPDGYHDYYNDRWYEYTGVPPGSTDGEAWNGMFHPDDQDRAWATWRHCLATGEPYHIEYRLRHVSGAYRWVLGRAQPVRDGTGQITRWFGTCTDIQDIVDARDVLARSRAELEAAVEERTRQLGDAEEQLRQAHKMEAVGQLTGGIAHDFNNMLAVVIGALDLLERRVQQGKGDLERYVTAAKDGASRAAALTQRLLAFSRQQPLAAIATDVNQLIDGTLDLLVRTLGEGVSVETMLYRGLWHALADPHQLENVIVNLAVNARDAMPGGGRLAIETANVTIGAARAQEFQIAEGDYVEVAVVDTGLGMSPEVARRAFEPFFTTKGVGKGTGLGLSQVFGFVRQSDGHVLLETAPGLGTTVRVLLPRAHVQHPVATAVAAPSEPNRGTRDEVILVVEDEDRVRSYSIEALRELGYSVADARDGPEALRIIERGQPVSLLFTDVVMPEMTGLELAERARTHLPTLKVLYTSGYTRDAILGAGADEGSVLPKPFGVDQLARRVRAALDS